MGIIFYYSVSPIVVNLCQMYFIIKNSEGPQSTFVSQDDKRKEIFLEIFKFYTTAIIYKRRTKEISFVTFKWRQWKPLYGLENHLNNFRIPFPFSMLLLVLYCFSSFDEDLADDSQRVCLLTTEYTTKM